MTDINLDSKSIDAITDMLELGYEIVLHKTDLGGSSVFNCRLIDRSGIELRAYERRSFHMKKGTDLKTLNLLILDVYYYFRGEFSKKQPERFTQPSEGKVTE